MPTICLFHHIENEHTVYCRMDCLKKFCESLREYAKNIIDFENKKSVVINKKELKLRQDTKICYICGKRILKKLSKSINSWNVKHHCHYTGKYRGATHSICNLEFNVPNGIPVIFYNCSNYDYHFVVKDLANKLEGKYEYLGKNTEK